jgi:hypothetical protein
MMNDGEKPVVAADGLMGLACVTISKLGQKVTLQGIEPGSLL